MVELVEGQSRKPRNIKASRARDPILRQLLAAADARLYGYKQIAVAAGCGENALIAIRRGREPLLGAVRRIARVLGYNLALTPLTGTQRAAAWALRLHGEIIDVTLDDAKAKAWALKGWTVVKLTEEETGDA